MTPFILCALISAISALVSLGFSIAAERTATGPARTMALYACARSLALFVASVVPFLSGSVGWLLAVAWSMIIVQALDAIVGMTIKDNVKTWPGWHRAPKLRHRYLAHPIHLTAGPATLVSSDDRINRCAGVDGLSSPRFYGALGVTDR
jgi:hypothetical protein